MTESKSWHHGGQNKVILCTECRIFYKKYSKLPPIEDDRKPPAYMFKVEIERELRDEDGYLVSGKLGLRSRRNVPMVQSTLRSGRNKAGSPTEGNSCTVMLSLNFSINVMTLRTDTVL